MRMEARGMDTGESVFAAREHFDNRSQIMGGGSEFMKNVPGDFLLAGEVPARVIQAQEARIG